MRRFVFLARRRVRRAVARLQAAQQRSRMAAVGVSSLPARPSATLGGTLRIVAHQDDDLLFQSVSLQHDVDERRAMTTIYLTAGDDDDDEWYWRAREAGVRAAYASLLGVGDVWLDDVLTMAGTAVAQATLAAAPRVRLLFVRLPDGTYDGMGGRRSGGASLRKLWEGTQSTMTTVDGTASHTLASLHAMLRQLVDECQPDQILSLDHVGDFGDGDHSDHHVVAYLAERVHAEVAAAGGVGGGAARAGAGSAGAGAGPGSAGMLSAAVAGNSGVRAPVPDFTGYRGYTIERFPANLSLGQIAAKEAAFFVYAQSDYKTCASVRACIVRPESKWLAREYEVSRVTA